MKPKLFLLSGLLCDQRVWREQIVSLGAVADVNAIDFREYDCFSDMVASVLHNAPDRFSLAGHSMGARVALEVYRKAPERVTRLALLDTGVHPVLEKEPDARHKLLALGEERGIEALADAWLPPMLLPEHAADHNLMLPLREMVVEMGVETFRRQVRALLSRPDATPVLRTISCPTLVGVGRHDSWSPLNQHEKIAELIADAQLVVYENSGHMAPYENPASVTASLEVWLRR